MLAVTLIAQARARRYVPAVYWAAAVIRGSVFGTMAADVAHVSPRRALRRFRDGVRRGLGPGVRPVAPEGTLAVKTVAGGRREVFYWCAVMATFALGTAVGDLAAATLG